MGTDRLVDAAMSVLFLLVEQSALQGPEGSALARDLRRLGLRTAKHPSELADRVITGEIEIDLTWRNPVGQRRMASLQRQAAMALEGAITLNREDTQIVDLVRDFFAISAAGRAELRADDGRFHMTAGRELAAALGPFYNERVVATVERVTTWSTNTGKEKKEFRFMSVRLAEPKPGSTGS